MADVGSIRYTTEVDVSDTLTAEKQLDKVTDKMVADFNKVDRSTQKLNTQITKTSKAVKTGMAGMGRGAGQAGIQFQQFIGQVQGGQSVMLAFSQQSADLGIVLGLPLVGAIAGISASLVGILLPSLLKTTEATKAFKFSVEDAAKELENLNDLTKAQVSIALINTSKSMDDLSKSAGESGEKIAKLNKILDDNARTTRDGRRRAILSAKQRKETIVLVQQEQANLDKINQEYKRQSDLLAKLSENKGGINKKTQKQDKAVESLTVSLEAQTIALRDGEEAAFRFATAQQLGLKAGEMLPDNIDAQIAAIFRLKAAQDSASEEKQAVNFAGGIVKRGQSPVERLELEHEQLLELKARFVERSAEFDAALTTNERQQSDLRTKNAVTSQRAMTGAVLGFISATTGALLSGMDEQSGAYKALFAIQKATQIASTIVNAETAATAAMASMPGPAGIVLAQVVRGLGYASAGIIAGTAIKGARQFGGPVTKGDAFRVGEAGPEIFTAGGKNFMIPGENGKVIANDDIGGGGFTQNVEIINNTPAQVSTQTSDDGRQMKIIINEVARQISDNQGVIPRALRSGTNTTFKANR